MLRRVLGTLAVGALFTFGCATGAPDEATDPGTIESTLTERPVPHLVHVLPPGGASTLSLRTLPFARCELTIPEAPGQALRVFADGEGIARVHLQHLAASGITRGVLYFECEDESGARMTHTVDVVADARARPQAPALVRARRATLPMLDVDADSLDDQALLARHYPPRPDADAAPEAYAAWLRLVTSAPALADVRLVEEDRQHGNGSSNNWSGYAIRTPASAPAFDWIYGQWNVPRSVPEAGFASYDSSTLWVGLDGYGTPGVVQDGTDQDTVTAVWVQTSVYDAWTEWYPANSQMVLGFPVNPGDEIHAWTWVRDANGNIATNATVGYFALWNVTRNVYVTSKTTAPKGTTFNGHTAEWIMERPSLFNNVTTLAQYAPCKLGGALAADITGGSHYYTSDNSDNVTMVNSQTGHVLSKVALVDASTMAFTWVAHK